MLSRLYKSARSLLSNSTTSGASNLTKGDNTSDQLMVAPRAQYIPEPAEAELTDENSINVYVPISSAKKRRRRAQDEGMNKDDGSATPSSKKRKVLPVRAKNMKSPKRINGIKDTIPVVEIPAKKIIPDVEIVDDEGESPSEREEDEPKKDIASASKHRRFSSEELGDELFSTAREQAAALEDNEDGLQVISSDEESEDEAPEALDIQEAAKTVKSKEREAAQAVKEQLSVSRKKRKERDDILKKQSASTKKRKRHLDISTEPEVLENDATELVDDTNEVEDGVLKEINIPHDINEPLSRQRGFLPDLLPAQYLEDTDPREMAVQTALVSKKAKAKKKKFQELVEKQPRDKHIGSTTYRVTKAQSTNLAPKSSFHAQKTKESWLQGRAGKSGSSNRKPVSQGFFKK